MQFAITFARRSSFTDNGFDEIQYEISTNPGAVSYTHLTEKGRGYEPARRNPDMFHGIGPFDVKTGRPTEQKSCPGYTDVFSEALCQEAEEEKKLSLIHI